MGFRHPRCGLRSAAPSPLPALYHSRRDCVSAATPMATAIRRAPGDQTGRSRVGGRIPSLPGSAPGNRATRFALGLKQCFHKILNQAPPGSHQQDYSVSGNEVLSIINLTPKLQTENIPFQLSKSAKVAKSVSSRKTFLDILALGGSGGFQKRLSIKRVLPVK